jgi:GNAT superfamily N-acetyltransferase
MNLTQLRRVTCRPALPQDTGDVLELTKTIWEGHDYVPRVWEEWLADPEGLLAVAEYAGHVVGISKLSRLTSDEWWLEGLRVHPKYQGQGIAAHLHDYLLDYWQRKAGGVIRLATASFNSKVHQMCERRGFRKVLEVSSFVSPQFPEECVGSISHLWTALRDDEIQIAWNIIHRSSLLALYAGLMDLDWHWGKVTVNRLAEAIQEQRAWWWRDRQGLLIQRLDEEEGISFPVIQLVACPFEAIADCLRDFKSFAFSQGYQRVRWFAPLHLELNKAMEEAGFQRDWEDSLYIYEKQKEG